MNEEILDYSSSTCAAIVVTAFIGWISLYTLLCRLGPARSAEWHCREVTALHATLVVAMSAWCGFAQGPWPFTDPGGPNTPLQHWTCSICLGYFLFDLCWCLYFGTEGPVMLFHHCLSIAGLSLVVCRGTSGTEMIASIFGSELTNPFLQMRWFLRECDLHKTWYAELNDAAFMLLFGFLRIGVASYLLYTHILHPRPDWIAKSGGIALYAVGWVFWIMIVRYALRKYSKMYHGWKRALQGGVKAAHRTGTSNGKPAVNGEAPRRVEVANGSASTSNGHHVGKKND